MSTEWIDSVAVVAVVGDVDLATAPGVDAEIKAALRASPAALVVDLSRVEFLASAGMEVLVTTNERVTPEVRFAIVADGPATSRPMSMVGLAEILSIHPTLDDALSRIQR